MPSPLPLCDRILDINVNIKPFQNIVHGLSDAVSRNRLDFTVVLLKIFLQVIDRQRHSIKLFLDLL